MYSRLASFGTANEPLNQTVCTVRVGWCRGSHSCLYSNALRGSIVQVLRCGPVGNKVDTNRGNGEYESRKSL